MRTRNFLLSVIFLTTILSCTSKREINVDYTNKDISYEGRINFTDANGAELFWSGTSIRINFTGKTIEALFEDERGDNYYDIIIDGKEPFMLKLDTGKSYYPLAEDLSKGDHSLEIFKRTEWDRGISRFYGFRITGNASTKEPDAPKKRKIEFYGNSITAGYAVEDFSGRDRSDSIFTNNYLSYSAITARHFDARYYCICKSGIGITISWFPILMPEIYDRINPNDSTSTWDFSKYRPDIVVINLLQNDSWLVEMPEREEFKTNFGTTPPEDSYIINAYQEFVASLRQHYPEAEFICMLGNMDITREGSKWPGMVEQAVNNLDDPKIHTLFVPFKDSPGHPTIAEQEVLANSLIDYIETHFGW